MKLRTAAQRLDISMQTIRDWLEFFEIQVERNSKNQRIISDEIFEKLELIKNELDFGRSRADVYHEFFASCSQPEMSNINQDKLCSDTTNDSISEGVSHHEFKPEIEQQIDKFDNQDEYDLSSEKQLKMLKALALFSCANRKTLKIMLFVGLGALGVLIWKQYQVRKQDKQYKNQTVNLNPIYSSHY